MSKSFDYDKFANVASAANKQAGKSVVDGASKKLGSSVFSKITKDNEKFGKNIGNLYTGKKLKSGIGLGVAAAGILYSASKMNSASTSLRPQNDPQYFNQLGNLSINSRTAPTAPLPSVSTVAPSVMAGGHITGGGTPVGGANNMGATGDMVFGMHNKRHGQ